MFRHEEDWLEENQERGVHAAVAGGAGLDEFEGRLVDDASEGTQVLVC